MTITVYTKVSVRCHLEGMIQTVTKQSVQEHYGIIFMTSVQDQGTNGASNALVSKLSSVYHTLLRK